MTLPGTEASAPPQPAPAASTPANPAPPQPASAPAASRGKAAVKAVARLLAGLAVWPLVGLYWLHAAVFGGDRSLESFSQLLSLWPGISGQYVRRAFLRQVLAGCGPGVVVEFGTLFSKTGAVLEENVYIGPRCVVGLVHLERDVLLAAHVQIPSGAHAHYFDDPGRPIREQGGERRRVRIGAGSWIGAGAIILADVGRGCVVGAGAVVTRPLPDGAIAVGVPARVIRWRLPPAAHVDMPEAVRLEADKPEADKSEANKLATDRLEAARSDGSPDMDNIEATAPADTADSAADATASDSPAP